MIGLDGADGEVLDRYSADGTLPNLAALRSRGAAKRISSLPGLGRLAVRLPPVISSIARSNWRSGDVIEPTIRSVSMSPTTPAATTIQVESRTARSASP